MSPQPYTILHFLAAQLLPHLPLWKNTPGSSTFNSLYLLWTNYHLALTSFYHLWTNYPPPLCKNYPPPLQLIHHFIPLGSSTLSSLLPLSTNYTLTLSPFYLPPLGSPVPTSFYPLWTNIPLQFVHQFIPLGSSTLSSLYPLWANYNRTLTPLYPSSQPKSYINLIQIIVLCIPSEQITPSLLHHFPL